MSSARFNWPALMQAGMRGLGLKPHEFWALTPAELELMLGPQAGIAPLRRGGLEALMADFPDAPNEKKDG